MKGRVWIPDRKKYQLIANYVNKFKEINEVSTVDLEPIFDLINYLQQQKSFGNYIKYHHADLELASQFLFQCTQFFLQRLKEFHRSIKTNYLNNNQKKNTPFENLNMHYQQGCEFFFNIDSQHGLVGHYDLAVQLLGEYLAVLQQRIKEFEAEIARPDNSNSEYLETVNKGLIKTQEVCNQYHSRITRFEKLLKQLTDLFKNNFPEGHKSLLEYNAAKIPAVQSTETKGDSKSEKKAEKDPFKKLDGSSIENELKDQTSNRVWLERNALNYHINMLIKKDGIDDNKSLTLKQINDFRFRAFCLMDKTAKFSKDLTKCRKELILLRKQITKLDNEVNKLSQDLSSLNQTRLNQKRLKLMALETRRGKLGAKDKEKEGGLVQQYEDITKAILSSYTDEQLEEFNKEYIVRQKKQYIKDDDEKTQQRVEKKEDDVKPKQTKPKIKKEASFNVLKNEIRIIPALPSSTKKRKSTVEEEPKTPAKRQRTTQFNFDEYKAKQESKPSNTPKKSKYTREALDNISNSKEYKQFLHNILKKNQQKTAERTADIRPEYCHVISADSINLSELKDITFDSMLGYGITALGVAATNLHCEPALLDMLIKHSDIDVIVKPSDKTRVNPFCGWSALMIACYFGNEALVTKLIANQVDVKFRVSDKGGNPEWSALEAAVAGGQLHIIKLLLKEHVDCQYLGSDAEPLWLSALKLTEQNKEGAHELIQSYIAELKDFLATQDAPMEDAKQIPSSSSSSSSSSSQPIDLSGDDDEIAEAKLPAPRNKLAPRGILKKPVVKKDESDDDVEMSEDNSSDDSVDGGNPSDDSDSDYEMEIPKSKQRARPPRRNVRRPATRQPQRRPSTPKPSARKLPPMPLPAFPPEPPAMPLPPKVIPLSRTPLPHYQQNAFAQLQPYSFSNESAPGYPQGLPSYPGSAQSQGEPETSYGQYQRIYSRTVIYPIAPVPGPGYPPASYPMAPTPAPGYPPVSYPMGPAPAPAYPPASYPMAPAPAPGYPPVSYPMGPAPGYPSASYPMPPAPVPGYPRVSYPMGPAPAPGYSMAPGSVESYQGRGSLPLSFGYDEPVYLARSSQASLPPPPPLGPSLSTESRGPFRAAFQVQAGTPSSSSSSSSAFSSQPRVSQSGQGLFSRPGSPDPMPSQEPLYLEDSSALNIGFIGTEPSSSAAAMELDDPSFSFPPNLNGRRI